MSEVVPVRDLYVIIDGVRYDLPDENYRVNLHVCDTEPDDDPAYD